MLGFPGDVRRDIDMCSDLQTYSTQVSIYAASGRLGQ